MRLVLTITPYDFTLIIKCWTHTLEAVTLSITTLIPSFLVYIHGTGPMKAIAELRDITFCLGFTTQKALGSQLKKEEPLNSTTLF